MGMDSRRLRYFAEIVDRGSMGAAALQLHISQAALSKSIRALEAELQVRLLDRMATGISPTAFGRALYGHARAVGGVLAEAEAEIARLRDETHARVALGVIPDLGSGLVPRAVAGFCAQRPRVQVRVVEDVTPELLPRMRRGELDFVIGLATGLQDEPTLKRRFLFDDTLSVIAAADHPLAGHKRVTPEELGAWPWIFATRGGSHRARLEQFFRMAGREPPRPQIECASIQFAKAAIQASRHLGALPLHALEAEIGNGLLRALPVRSAALGRRIALLYFSDRPLSAEGRALVQQVRLAWGSSHARLLAVERG